MRNNSKKCGIVVLLFSVFTLSGCLMLQPLNKQEREALTEIIEILNTSIDEAHEKMQRYPDPTSPLQYFVKELDAKREYVKQMETGKIPFDPRIVSHMTSEAVEIQTNIKNPVDRILEADVSFGLGKYKVSDLSEEGKEKLREFVDDVFNTLVKKQRELFPDKTLVIVIKTIGYADEISPASTLAEELIKDKTLISDDPAEKRQILNTELSRLRSQTVNEYITSQLEIHQEPYIKIGKPYILGLGEKLPYPQKVFPPYKPEDKRRRICKIYSNVFIDRE